MLPVFGLFDALGICLCKGRLALEGGDGNGELGHWVEVVGAAVDQLLDKLGQVGARGPLGGQIAHLLLDGDFAGEKQPEKTFWERLLATGGLGEDLLTFGNLRRGWSEATSLFEGSDSHSLATEANALFRVEHRAFPDQRLDAAGAAIDLVQRDFANDLGTIVLPQLLDLFDIFGNLGGKRLLERLCEM